MKLIKLADGQLALHKEALALRNGELIPKSFPATLKPHRKRHAEDLLDRATAVTS